MSYRFIYILLFVFFLTGCLSPTTPSHMYDKDSVSNPAILYSIHTNKDTLSNVNIVKIDDVSIRQGQTTRLFGHGWPEIVYVTPGTRLVELEYYWNNTKYYDALKVRTVAGQYYKFTFDKSSASFKVTSKGKSKPSDFPKDGEHGIFSDGFKSDWDHSYAVPVAPDLNK